MKNPFKNVNEKWKEYALAGCVTVTLLVALLNIGKIFSALGSFLGLFSPVFLGVIIAYVMDPLAVFFCKKLFGKMKREKLAWTLSVFLSVMIVLGFLTLVVSMLVPQVAGNIQSLLDNAEGYLDSLTASMKPTATLAAFPPKLDAVVIRLFILLVMKPAILSTTPFSPMRYSLTLSAIRPETMGWFSYLAVRLSR